MGIGAGAACNGPKQGGLPWLWIAPESRLDAVSHWLSEVTVASALLYARLGAQAAVAMP